MTIQQLKNRLFEPVREVFFQSGYDDAADEAAGIACDVIFSDPLVAAVPELLATCKDAVIWWHGIPAHFETQEPSRLPRALPAIGNAEKT